MLLTTVRNNLRRVSVNLGKPSGLTLQFNSGCRLPTLSQANQITQIGKGLREWCARQESNLYLGFRRHNPPISKLARRLIFLRLLIYLLSDLVRFLVDKPVDWSHCDN